MSDDLSVKSVGVSLAVMGRGSN